MSVPVEPENVVRDYFLSSKSYDILKWLAQIGLPALGTLYFGLAQIWGLPNAEKVVGTIVVIDTFLGVLLNLASKSYDKSEAKYDGFIEIKQKEDGPKIYSLNLQQPPDALADQQQIVFKVRSIDPS